MGVRKSHSQLGGRDQEDASHGALRKEVCGNDSEAETDKQISKSSKVKTWPLVKKKKKKTLFFFFRENLHNVSGLC